MTTAIALTPTSIDRLDLTPADTILQSWIAAGDLATHEQQLQFQIDYPQTSDEPQEYSQIAPVRLWFIRLDSVYPWLPFVLDWQAGELARYTAMLVPHQFDQSGIQYNPEALDIFVMQKIFTLQTWFKTQGIPGDSRIRNFAAMFGYELDQTFFDLLHQ